MLPVLLLVFILTTLFGCYSYSGGMRVSGEMLAPLSASISAAGILDRRESAAGGVQTLEGGGEALAKSLGIRNADGILSAEELAVVESSPAMLQIKVDQLANIRDQIGTRFLLTGSAGVELVDLQKRWVIGIVIPLLYTAVVIPIPVTFSSEKGVVRQSVTTRIVDLETGEIVGSSVHVSLDESNGEKYPFGRVRSAVRAMGLRKKHFRKKKEKR